MSQSHRSTELYTLGTDPIAVAKQRIASAKRRPKSGLPPAYDAGLPACDATITAPPAPQPRARPMSAQVRSSARPISAASVRSEIAASRPAWARDEYEPAAPAAAAPAAPAAPPPRPPKYTAIAPRPRSAKVSSPRPRATESPAIAKLPLPSYDFSPSELHAFALPGVPAALTDRLAATPGARARPATAGVGKRPTELPPTAEAAASFFAKGGGSGELKFVHLMRETDADGGLSSAYELAVLPPEQSRFAEFVMSATGVVCHVDLAGASALHGGGDGGGGSSSVPGPRLSVAPTAPPEERRYACPVYLRHGTLRAVGGAPAHVCDLPLPALDVSGAEAGQRLAAADWVYLGTHWEDHWVRRGVALLCRPEPD